MPPATAILQFPHMGFTPAYKPNKTELKKTKIIKKKQINNSWGGNIKYEEKTQPRIKE